MNLLLYLDIEMGELDGFEWEQEQAKKKKTALKKVVINLEQTANSLFDPTDPEWNLLLQYRDKLSKHIGKRYPT